MKKSKNKEEVTKEVIEEKEIEEKENKEVKEVDTKVGIKKSIFYIFYLIFGVACLVLFILTFFEGPRNFIVDKAKIIVGLVIIVYAILFLLPYTFKKKESALINFLTFIELGIIALIGIVLMCSDNKILDIDRSLGLVVYIFGLTEIIRGYHSNGGVKLFKSAILNGLIKYFNIFLITLGTYIFFGRPFGTNIVLAIRITLMALAIFAVIIGLLKIPKKKKKEGKETH